MSVQGKYLLQLAMKVPNGSIDVDSLQPCNQEEANTCMFLHAVHASSNRSSRVTIKNNDSDIL